MRLVPSLSFRRCASACAAAAFALVFGSAQAAPPPAVTITAALTSLWIDGDCNNPAVWVDGQVRVYGSPYPQNGSMGGVATFRAGATLESIGAAQAVNPDRSRLGACRPAAFGPWFESIVADDQGVLWAYYHAEFPNPEETKVHPRIGAQVSRDGGASWTDLGVLLDTPAGTDELHSWLGYGFSGGNGDFSVLLDPSGTYLYFFFSQYGAPADAQGVALARMRWADRAEPVGKVLKWCDGGFTQPGLGGRTTPFLANVGDAHGLRAPFDFWWGPSIHWNTHLQRYVILLNRSNTGDFTFNNGVANWYLTGTKLDDPSTWDDPAPLPFPDGYQGSWYPQVIGTGAGETDKLAGETARLFVHGLSSWTISFVRPEPPPAPSEPEWDPTKRPAMSISVGDGSRELFVHVGETLPITGRATDRDGDMSEHWLEIRNPAGQWSWEGWLTGEPWAGALGGNAFASTKSTTFTFTEEGTYVVRTTAIDPANCWIISDEIPVHVTR